MLAVVVVATFTAVRARRRGDHYVDRTRISWFVAAGASATMLVFTTAEVVHLAPSVTVVDGATVALTGVLTGLFLGLGLARAGRNPAADD
jgi:hypothetical protein